MSISKILKSIFPEFFVVLLAGMIVGAEKVVFRVNKGVKVIEFFNLLGNISDNLLSFFEIAGLKLVCSLF